ncbi:MAG TPA: RNA polymerase sigma factor [Sandaracinaceae bacterium LLY-WYZ-13_1]|nr:RNA polymerase sigma factor [Sandaracinaceae bacterium LLY-WYZ-13_1]
MNEAKATDDAPSAEVEALFRAHGAYVMRAARYLGVAERDLDDVVQEVFLVALRRASQFRGNADAKSWLYGIALRVVSAYRRRAHRRREVPTADLAHRGGATADPMERRTARSLVNRALEALDEDKRAVFVLFELEELTMREVARAQGCHLKTAYSRLYAAREIMRGELRRLSKEEE